MKSLLFALSALLVLTTSCNQTTDNKNLIDNIWILDGTRYKVAEITRNDTANAISVVDLYSNGINFYFGKLPMASGDYSIVRTPQQPNELAIFAVKQDSTRVYASNVDNKTASITVDGGKIRIKTDKITVENVNQPGDKIELQITISEK